jgi:hypothetical protein
MLYTHSTLGWIPSCSTRWEQGNIERFHENQQEQKMKMTSPSWLSILAILSALLLGACSLLTTPTPVQPREDDIATAAAMTVVAELTRLATQSSPTPIPPSATPLPPPTFTPTVGPTETPLPTATPTATFTPTTPPIPCNWADFVDDVTVEDGTTFTPGTPFTKVWRFRNQGTCTWTVDYDLVFDGGDLMDGPITSPLPGIVRPGDVVDISVNLTAPEDEGRYRGFWKLREPGGVLFGVGPDANDAFWVGIEVVEPTERVYDFVDNVCDADWHNGVDDLPCPGVQGDGNGFVVVLDRPRLENGTTENEPALFTQPRMVTDGLITGRFPEFRVRAGDRFRAIIGCLSGGFNCDVTFRLRYRVRGRPIETLESWNEFYDGRFTRVDVNLSELAGEDVEFVLSVRSNGSPNEDWAFWLAPRIMR